MPGIKLTGFIGEQPRIIARLLPDTAATRAVNVRLDDGGLTPYRVPLKKGTAGGADHKTIHYHDGEWLSWDTVVHAAPGPVAEDRLYYTGDGKPKMRVGGTVYDLAVPRPTTKLTPVVSGTAEEDAEVVTRLYVYTFVTEFGEESEPCPASDDVDWKPGQSVTLSGFEAAPAGRAITKQRIYRNQTGQSGTYFYLIDERDASSSDYVDTIPVDEFAEPLPSIGWNAPPDALEGLTTLPNGMMAGFVGRDLYFCEPFRPHAWPQVYALTTDYDIVALGATQTSILVATTGQPYMVVGSTPESMQMTKLKANLPCINGRALVDLGSAICYPTHEGLVAFNADGSIGLVTSQLFNRDAWLRLSPQTMVAGQHSGRYVAFYDTTTAQGEILAGALFIDISNSPYLSRSSALAAGTFFDLTESALYYLASGTTDIYRLDAPEGQREQMYWRSKEFVLPYPETFGAILIDSDSQLSGQEQANAEAAAAAAIARNAAILASGELAGAINAAPINVVPLGGDAMEPIPDQTQDLRVGVYADGARVAEVSATGTPVRLPGGFRARKWEIDVSGDVTVNQIAMARNIDELKTIA